jgi:hypothetical protein
MRSCLDTLRKQGHGMLDVLQRTFSDNPIRPAHSYCIVANILLLNVNISTLLNG